MRLELRALGVLPESSPIRCSQRTPSSLRSRGTPPSSSPAHRDLAAVDPEVILRRLRISWTRVCIAVGIVVHPDAQIGRDVVLCQQVTIGGTGTRQGAPVIGDGVYL